MNVMIADAIIIQDNKILMVQQRKEMAYAKWSFPGGRGEIGETPEQTVQREVLEEIGLNLEDAKLLKNYSITKQDVEFDLYTYIGQINGRIHLKDDELMAYGWFSLDSIMELKEALRHPVYLELAIEAFNQLKSTQ